MVDFGYLNFEIWDFAFLKNLKLLFFVFSKINKFTQKSNFFKPLIN